MDSKVFQVFKVKEVILVPKALKVMQAHQLLLKVVLKTLLLCLALEIQ